MQIIVNDTAIDLPTKLSDITLGQRISFHEQYGKELDEMIDVIRKMEDGPEKDLEAANYNYQRMLRVFAFIADVSLESITDGKFIEEIAAIYYGGLAELFKDNPIDQPGTEFEFKSDQWELAEPELTNGSLMSFGEFIDAKQLVKDMMDGGNGKWEIVKYLAAIYLRKKGEAYKEQLIYETSERLKLMEELPMDIALQVDFFLSSITSFSIPILRYSVNPGLRDLAKTCGSILSNTAG